MISFRKLLDSSGTVLLDGAMGTELDKRGASQRCEANISHPEKVLSVHQEYLRAGSAAIITNTLTMNRIFIESHGLRVDVREVNLKGAYVARQASRGEAFVLGNLSSTGQLLEPYGGYSEQRVTDAFKEQAGYLLEAAVDGFIIETMIDLREAVCALRACKRLSDLPTIACIAYHTTENGGRTAMGNSARDCASRLSDEGAAAIGANCGDIDPDEMAEIISTMVQHTTLPVVAEPNAGKPRLLNQSTVYDMGAEPFAQGVLRCMEAGARILGGCCGTTPAHIMALRGHLRDNGALE